MKLLYGFGVVLFLYLLYFQFKREKVKPYQEQVDSLKDFCVIDIRDYISAYRSPFPGAENIPLSYLQRAIKERFDCPKNILVITDDKRRAKLAAKMIRRNKDQPIYYIHSKKSPLKH